MSNQNLNEYSPLLPMKDTFKAGAEFAEHLNFRVLDMYMDKVPRETLSLFQSLLNLLSTLGRVELYENIEYALKDRDIDLSFYKVAKGWEGCVIRTDYHCSVKESDEAYSISVSVEREMYKDSPFSDNGKHTYFSSFESVGRELTKPVTGVAYAVLELLDMAETKLANEVVLDLREWMESPLCKKNLIQQS